MIEQIDARCVERMIDDNLLNTCPFEHTHTYSYASKTLIVFFSRYTIDLSKDQRRKKTETSNRHIHQHTDELDR